MGNIWPLFFNYFSTGKPAGQRAALCNQMHQEYASQPWARVPIMKSEALPGIALHTALGGQK